MVPAITESSHLLLDSLVSCDSAAGVVMLAASNTEHSQQLPTTDPVSKLPDVKPNAAYFNPNRTPLYACSAGIATTMAGIATTMADMAPDSGYFGYRGGRFDAEVGSTRDMLLSQLSWPIANCVERSVSCTTDCLQKHWDGGEYAPKMRSSPLNIHVSPDVPGDIAAPTSYRRRKSERRRYKTPSPQLLRIRREAANARERRRMHNLNLAFEQLRTVLPAMENGRRLSKFETLQVAQQYIDCLSELLSTEPPNPHT